jgi:ATP-dependent exoDNAse (exonuclease V) alpha subunit
MDMEKDGFPFPSTVANFLLKRELAENAVVVVDESGQIGGGQMLELLRLAHERKARVILSGDTRQHGAVDASDALRVIERFSGVRPIELHRVRRQDPALGRYEGERVRIRNFI